MAEIQVHVSPDAESLAAHACSVLVQRIQEHQTQTDAAFVLVLAGGSTPKRLYQLLSELPLGTVDWNRVILIWGDERNVPADHADSNYRMVDENLLQKIAIPIDNVLGVPQPGGSASEAAQSYEKLLRGKLNSPIGFPKVDYVLLGMGDDVHTASLFPETKALTEANRLVVENWVEKLDCWRITLSAIWINQAKEVVFLIAGKSKEHALHLLWHGERDAARYPAQLICPEHGCLRFLVDEAALGENRPPESAILEYQA